MSSGVSGAGVVGITCIVLAGFVLVIARCCYSAHLSRQRRKKDNNSMRRLTREQSARREQESADRLARATAAYIQSTATTVEDTRFKDAPDLEALPVYSDADEPPVYGEHTTTRLVTPPPAAHVRQ